MKIQEALDYSQATVDREAGVIRGIKVLGEESQNGLVYPLETRRAAHSLIEGVRVNVDHPAKKTLDPLVPLSSRLGKLFNVREDVGGTFADLRYFKSHPVAAILVEAAENPDMSDLMGMSINGAGKTRKRPDGKYLVESLDRLTSVDLVSEPATVRGLREAVEEEGEGEEMLTAEEHYEGACTKACIDILIDIIDGDKDLAEGLKEIKSHVAEHHKKYKKEEKEEEHGEGEEEVEESRKPAISRDLVLLVESMGVTPTSALLDQLAGAEDEAERRALITAAKRKALVKAPRSGKPEVVLQESKSEAERDAELVNSMRRRWY